MSAPPRPATGTLLAVAAAKVAIHLPWLTEYGFHRDELYYLACGRHPAWGYVDQPPLVPMLARGVEAVAGPEPGPMLAAMRLLAVLGGAVLVVLAGLLAREMGGRRWAQGLAATAVAAAPVFLTTNHLFQTVTFEQLAWVGATLILARLLRTGDGRLWLGVGALAGLGLLTKLTMVLFGFGLVAGLLLTPARRWLRSPWLWAGGGVALALAAPHLAWQRSHGWPSLEFIAERGARTAAEFGPPAFLGIQLLFVGLLALPVFVAGVRRLFARDGATFRPLGWIWLAVSLLLLVGRGKPYYPAPSWPAIFAAGAVAMELWLAMRPGRRWRTVIPAAVALGTIPTLWICLPLVPPERFAAGQDAWPHAEFREELAWPELAEQVAAVLDGLPPAERRRAGLFTDSYGEAAALDLYGRPLGLPPATSGHNSYWFWGPPDTDVVVAVAWGRERLDRAFEEVVEIERVSNRLGIRNEAWHQTIYLCRRPRAPWATLWPRLRHFV